MMGSQKDFRECCFKTVPPKGRRLIWEITHACDFRCEYCFQERKRILNPARVLNTNDLMRICSKLKTLKISDVLITGGEIFKAIDVLDPICDRLKRMNIPYSFSTMMFTKKDFIDKLFTYNPLNLNVSLDPHGSESLRVYNGY